MRAINRRTPLHVIGSIVSSLHHHEHQDVQASVGGARFDVCRATHKCTTNQHQRSPPSAEHEQSTGESRLRCFARTVYAQAAPIKVEDSAYCRLPIAPANRNDDYFVRRPAAPAQVSARLVCTAHTHRRARLSARHS
jgi:hypothetical protein